MNRVAIALWVATIIILGSGFLGFYVLAAIVAIIAIFLLVFYKPLLRRQWRKEDLDYLDTLFRYHEREAYERRRQTHINLYGRDPGSYDERLLHERQEISRIH